MGAHSIKFGGGAVARVRRHREPAGFGTWTFNSNLTRNSAGQEQPHDGVVHARVCVAVRRLHSPYRPSLSVPKPNLYLQDDWRMTSWLTVNLGLRYDIYYPSQKSRTGSPTWRSSV